MNKPRPFLILLCVSSLAAMSGAMAGPKEYPLTGPIVSISDTTLVVQQARTKETWEFARTPDTKGAADLKVGDRVTVHYSMQAVSVEPKPEKAPKASPSAPSASPAKAAAAASPAR